MPSASIALGCGEHEAHMQQVLIPKGGCIDSGDPDLHLQKRRNQAKPSEIRKTISAFSGVFGSAWRSEKDKKVQQALCKLSPNKTLEARGFQGFDDQFPLFHRSKRRRRNGMPPLRAEIRFSRIRSAGILRQ